MAEKAPWDTTNEVAPWESVQQDTAPWDEGGAEASFSTPEAKSPESKWLGEGGTLESTGDLILGSVKQTLGSLGQLATTPLPTPAGVLGGQLGLEPREEMQAGAVELTETGREEIAESTPANQPFWQQAYSNAVQSAAMSGTSLALGGFGGLALGLTSMGTQVGALSYAEALKEGKDPITAFRYGAIDGVLEGASEALPFKRLLATHPTLRQKLIDVMKAEIPGELVAETTQKINAYFHGLDDNVTVGDFVETWKMTAASTLIGGSVQTAAMHGVQKIGPTGEPLAPDDDPLPDMTDQVVEPTPKVPPAIAIQMQEDSGLKEGDELNLLLDEIEAEGELVLEEQPEVTFGQDIGELETMYDLAKAYAEMGDNEGAQSIVAEIYNSPNITPELSSKVAGLYAEINVGHLEDPSELELDEMSSLLDDYLQIGDVDQAQNKLKALAQTNNKKWIQFVEDYSLGARLHVEDITIEAPIEKAPWDVTDQVAEWSDKDLRKTGPQAGSNEGGTFTDHDTNEQFYIKYPQDEDRVHNEVLAGKLYKAAGVLTPKLQAIHTEGGVGIASTIIPDLKEGTPQELAAAKGARENFIVDAWLANWDVIGLEYDNMVIDSAGNAVRLDPGGALLFRAQGGKKGDAFTPGAVHETYSMTDSTLSPQAASVFTDMTDAEISAGIRKVQRVTPEMIDQLVDAHGPNSGPDRQILKSRLKSRRSQLLSKQASLLKKLGRKKPDAIAPVTQEIPKKVFASWAKRWNSSEPKGVEAKERSQNPHFGPWKDVEPADARYGVLLVDPDSGRVLLREPANHFDGYHWTFAKGGADINEHPVDAAKRELVEETGYDTDIVDKLDKPFYSGTDTAALFYLGVANGSQRAFEWETSGTKWATYEEAKALIQEGTNVQGVQRDLEVLEELYKKGGSPQKGTKTEIAKVLVRNLQSIRAFFQLKADLPGVVMPETWEDAVNQAGPEVTLQEDIPVAFDEYLYDVDGYEYDALKNGEVVDSSANVVVGASLLLPEEMRKELQDIADGKVVSQHMNSGAAIDSLNQDKGVRELRDFTRSVIDNFVGKFVPSDRDPAFLVVDDKQWKAAGMVGAPNAWGSMFTGGPLFDKTVIRLNLPQMLEQYGGFTEKLKQHVYETLSHELGHYLLAHELLKAPVATQKALTQEYFNWLKERHDLRDRERLSEIVQSVQPAATAHANVNYAGNLNAMDVVNYDSLTSMGEFLADGVARYMSEKQEMHPPVRKFFAQVFKKLKDFFGWQKANKWRAPPVLSAWLDELRFDKRLKTLQMEGIKLSDVAQNLASTDPTAVQYALGKLDDAVHGALGLKLSGGVKWVLNERNFLRWWNQGGEPSKWVDKNGQPMVMYHGGLVKSAQTDAVGVNEEAFSEIKKRHSSYSGMSFASMSPQTASGFAHSPLNQQYVSKKAVVLPLYVYTKKPWDHRNPDDIEAARQWMLNENGGHGVSGMGIEQTISHMKKGEWTTIEDDYFIDNFIKIKGYDAVTMREYAGAPVNIAVLDAGTQFKSATGNHGKYSITNKKLSHANVPEGLPPGPEALTVKTGPLEGQTHPSVNISRFNAFMKYMLTPEQIGWQNMKVPGVARYIRGIMDWWADKSALTALADARARALAKMDKKELQNFSHYVHEVTIQSDEKERKLTVEEKTKIAEKYPLTERAQQLVEETSGDFALILNDVMDVLKADLPRRFRHLPEGIRLQKIAEMEAKLDAERTAMLDRDYWPLSRFGKFWVQVETKVPVSFQGRDFNAGSVVLFEAYETVGEQRARKAQLSKQYGAKANVGSGKFSDTVMSFQGMPPQLVARLKAMMAAGTETEQMLDAEKAVKDAMTDAEFEAATKTYTILKEQAEKNIEDQLTGFDEMLHNMAPGQSFKQRLQRRKGTPGYSLDAVRGYATYMQTAANHLARIRHYAELMDSIDDMKEFRKQVEKTDEGNSLMDLEDYFRQHYQYAMNPGEEWAYLRAFGFQWYLGGVVKSAAINLTQTALMTGPVLTDRYGVKDGISYMSKAMVDLRKGLSEDHALEGDLLGAIDWGVKQGFLNESLATELSALSQGSNLQQLMLGSFLKSDKAAKGIRVASEWGAYLFQNMEKVNRYIAFMASYRLARDKMLKEAGVKTVDELTDEDARADLMEKARWSGRDIIDRTQFEYARWNRPMFMRHRRSHLFLFKMYQQNFLYFTFTDPAKWKMMLMMGLMAGGAGLPFAEDIWRVLEIMAHFMSKTLGIKNPIKEAEVDAAAFIQDLGVRPDLLLHGMSRYTFGMWDLSGSLGQGSQVPGMEALKQGATGVKSYDKVWPSAVEDIAGPVWGIPSRFLQAMSSESPDKWREWEKALPKALNGPSKALRRWSRGYESNYAGHDIGVEFKFDPYDMEHNAKLAGELGGQALGFATTRVTEESELRWLTRQHIAYWQSQRQHLLKQLGWVVEIDKGDNREAIADLKKAIKKYNNKVPDRGMRISGDTVQASLASRGRAAEAAKRGLPTQRAGRQISQELREAWTEESP